MYFDKDQLNTKRSRTENALRVIAGSFLRQVLELFLPFIARTVMIKTLGSLYSGLNGIFYSILQVLNLAELGVGEALVFSMYRPLAQKDHAQICALLCLYRKVYRLIGIVIAILGLLVLPFIRHLISGEIPADISLPFIFLLTLADTCIPYLTTAYKRSLFIADQRGDIVSALDCILQLIGFALRMMALLIMRSYYLYCVVGLLTTSLGCLFIHLVGKRCYSSYSCIGSISVSDRLELKKKTTGAFLNRFAYVCRNSFDNLTISAFMGLAVVVIFQNYYLIMTSVTKLTTLLGNGILACVGNSIVLESKEKNYRDFQKFQLIFLWITGWFAACMLCLYQPFMNWWLGTDFLLPSSDMMIFCVYYLFDMMGLMCYIYREAAGLFQYRIWIPLLEAGVNIALNLLLVKRFGVIGVLLSTILCQMFINLPWSFGVLFDFYFSDTKKYLFFLKMLTYVLITALACAVCWNTCGLVHVDGLTGLVLKVLICSVVPNLVFFVAMRIFPEYDDAVQFIMYKIFHINLR